MEGPKKPSKCIFWTQAQIKRQMSGVCVKFASCEIGDHAREVLEDLQDNKFETFEELYDRAMRVLEEVHNLKKGTK